MKELLIHKSNGKITPFIFVSHEQGALSTLRVQETRV
jgi:hypothetical protein